MAASMISMMASTSGSGSLQLAGGSKVNLNTRTWSVAKAPAFVGRRGVVRCDAGNDSDVRSKNVNTQEKVENNQPGNTPGKKPLFGTEGAPGSSFFPRLDLNGPTESDSTDIGQFFAAAKQVVDKATKKVITAEQVEHNQAYNTSEKNSVFGTKPASGAPYPRPEIERRPETGSRDIGSIFAFDGPGPETFNGRLAMVGLVWAFFAEMGSGLTVWDQLYSDVGGFGLVYYVAVVQLITFASIIPFLNGESTDARSFGPFRAQAERWNGRLAMLGFLSLVLTETFIHAPVFPKPF